MAPIAASVRGNALRLVRRLHPGGLADFAAANHDRFPLWLPVLFGAGIALYFSLAAEPAFWWGAGILGAALLGLAATRRERGAVFAVAVALAVASAGFCTAQLRALSAEAPRIEKRLGPVEISGRVLAAEPATPGLRLLLDELAIPRLPGGKTPERVRVSLRVGGDLRPGDRVRLLAILQPPPQPSLPGGFDFARKAWFERIGGVGFALGGPREVVPGEGGGTAIRIARLRQAITQRILAGAEPGIAPVAAALMTGERRSIPERILADMRDSGLAHLLAISGLHIGLVAGLLFFAVRLLLAMHERIALLFPIKKIAAVAALAGAFAYLQVSGAPIPTQRAFLMVAIALFAVTIDRNALSMRLVAVAAAVVLAIAPESLLSASFQMSFAAVVGLIAVYEKIAPRLAGWRQAGWVGSRPVVFVAATLLTTVVATLATSPFALYHFHRLALYGLASNMIAVPLTAMWIMPWAVLAFLLMPLGLEELALAPMGWGIEAVLTVARGIASLPGAVLLVPATPVLALGAVALGGIWLCLWRGPGRLASLPVIAAAAFAATFVRAPDIVVDGEAHLFAVNLGGGSVVMTPGDGDRFEREMWLRHFAADDPADWPAGTAATAVGMACDGEGCIAELHGRTVAIVSDVAAAAEDCGRVDHVIVLTRMPRFFCRGSAVAASTFHLWRDGAHAIYLSRAGVRVETVRESRGDRPWSRLPARKRQYLRTRPTRRP